MPDTLVVSHSNHSKNPKNKRGRPKKSHLLTKDNMAEPPVKKLKSSSTKKAHKSPDEGIVNISASALAVELGFEEPHEQITIKSAGNDKDEEITKNVSPVEIIQQLIDYQKSCKCSCLADLNIHDIVSHRIEITLLDRHSRDFFIMGLLRCGAVSFKDAGQHNSHTRNRYSYRLMNTRICQCCFLAVNNIGRKYLKNLKKHLVEHGVTSRLHGNHGRKPHHAINSSDITDVVEFVKSYASSHGVPATRRPKNPKAEHIIRLPPSDNVTSLHKKYKEFYEHSSKRAVALTSFRKIWSHHLPHIKLTFKEYLAAVKNLAPNVSLQEPRLTVEGNPQHSLLSQMSQIKVNSQDTNNVTQSMELQTEKSPVNLPYEYSGAELPHNHTIPLNMYMADSGNHEALPFGFLFSQTSVPLSHQVQTVMINSTAPTNDHTSIKADTTQEQTSHSSNQHASFPATVSSPVKHVASTDTFNPVSDKHVLLFSPNSALDANSGPVHMAQFSQKNPTEMYNHTSLTTSADPDILQEPPSLVGSGLTALTQQIQMSLFQ